MAVIRCKMCGGDLVIKPDSTVAECEYCGTVQTVPTVNNEKKLTLFNRAHRLFHLCEFDKAAAVYEQIVEEYPEEAESYWGLVLCDYGIEYVDDPKSGKKVPTCHRSSYNSVLENKDFSMAMEYADVSSRKLYRQEAKQIEQLRKDIIAVSGQEAPYDIFICYKENDEDGNRTIDSVLAQDLYKALTEAGYRVFFSRISLEEKLGREYEPFIFAALNSAQIMLVVSTDYERFHAVWVKNEWSRFLKLMEKDKQKHLIPCYRDIDAYDMPLEFARLQAQDMGKVGAVQDLLRGIEKLMPQKKQTTVIHERILVSENTNVVPLLRRVALFLEDKDWDTADKYCEKVLDIDPENADAYFGKLMAEYRISREADLQFIDPACLNSANYGKALRFGDSTMQEKLEGIRKDTVYQTAKKLADQKGRRQQKEKLWEVVSRLETIPHWRDSDQLMESYSQELASVLQKEEAARQAKQSRREQQKETRKWKQGLSLPRKVIVVMLCVVILLEAMVFAGLIPRMFAKREPITQTEVTETMQVSINFEKETQSPTEVLSEEEIQYRQAETWESEGQLGKAAIAFGKLGDYSDARERSFELWRQVNLPHTISTGGYSTAAVKADGSVLLDNYVDSRQAKCREWSEIISVCTTDSLSDGHTVGLKADGTVLSVGATQWNQCDTSGWKDVVAIEATAWSTLGLKKDGTVLYTGHMGYNDKKNESFLEKLHSWNDVVSISAGSGGVSIAAVRSDGTVLTLANFDVSDWTDIISVEINNSHIVGLKSDGSVVASGRNNRGQCNVSGWTDITAIAVGRNYTLGLKEDGTVVVTGSASDNVDEPIDVSGWRNITAICAGGDSRPIGLQTDGSVVTTDKTNAAFVKWTNLALPGQLGEVQ